MTRKRFIKLLMADGYSRNDANMLAEDARHRRMKYSIAYNFVQVDMDKKIDLTKVNIDVLCDAIRSVVDVALKMATAFSASVCAFAAAYKAEMEGLQ